MLLVRLFTLQGKRSRGNALPGGPEEVRVYAASCVGYVEKEFWLVGADSLCLNLEA